jgi:hypothetical protein
MSTKLGAHILVMTEDAARIIAAGPSVVKFVGDWAAAANLPSGTLAVGRKMCDDDAQSQRERGKSPAAAAHEFLIKWKQLEEYQHNPAIKYWEGHNEPVWVDREGVAWYAQMEIERMKMMDDAGLKCVIGNFATGTPPFEIFEPFVEACRYARDHGHMLGLHEYSTPFIWWMTGRYQLDPTENCRTSDDRLAGWTTLRYRQFYDRFLKPAGLADLPLVITEAGLDPMVGPAPDHWPNGTFKALAGWWSKGPRVWGVPLPNDFVPPGGWHIRQRDRFYFEQLWWYEQHLRQDPFVVGATIFTVGSFGEPWSGFDVSGTDVAPLLTQHATQSRV